MQVWRMVLWALECKREELSNAPCAKRKWLYVASRTKLHLSGEKTVTWRVAERDREDNDGRWTGFVGKEESTKGSGQRKQC